MAEVSTRGERLRAFFLAPKRIPGWVLFLLAAASYPPDWKARWDFWVAEWSAHSKAITMLAPLLTSPYLGLGLILAGVVYLYFIRGVVHVHHHHSTVTLQGVQATAAVGTLTVSAPPSPQDCNTWLVDAVHYIIGRRWLRANEGVGISGGRWLPGEKAFKEIREKAGSGILYMEGKLRPSYLPQPINPAHWRDHHITLESFLAGGREGMKTERAPESNDRTSYQALKVNKAQVERLWPPSP
jgi:hypothetical protein